MRGKIQETGNGISSFERRVSSSRVVSGNYQGCCLFGDRYFFLHIADDLAFPKIGPRIVFNVGLKSDSIGD